MYEVLSLLSVDCEAAGIFRRSLPYSITKLKKSICPASDESWTCDSVLSQEACLL